MDFGFVEIELLGQTVNHWRDPVLDLDFADLLDAAARLEGLKRLRFVTSYPRDFTPRMVEQFSVHTNISPYLHLPVQSGSDSVLKRMGRGYEVDAYLNLIESIKRARPGIALSTDMIVGFPGETEEDFQQTLDLVRRVRYSSIYAFKYSPRPGTAAPRLRGSVDDEVASRRLQDLFAVQTEIQTELNQQLIGETLEVLVTGWSKEPDSQMGRTPCHRIIHFASGPNPAELGSLVSVTVGRANPHSLKGCLESSIAGPQEGQSLDRLPVLSA